MGTKEHLLEVVSEMIGRKAEVEKLQDGKYAVVYFNVTEPPPPKGNTEEEALKSFIQQLLNLRGATKNDSN